MEWQSARERMVLDQLIRRGIRDERVLSAMRTVPREVFVPKQERAFAYADQALRIGEGQTISQPYVVARSLELCRLTGTERVLEVGTGSGYQAALLFQLVAKVITVERIAILALRAGRRLRRLGCDNVLVVVGDGSRGYQKGAPYDAIVAAAAVREIPEEWKKQLLEGGRMVVPRYDNGGQDLLVGVKRDGKMSYKSVERVLFVPMVIGN